MAITGPIIPAKTTVPGAVPSASTTIKDSLVTSTSTEVTDRAVQVGEIVTNVADGKLWLKKADETFAPLTRSKTLAIWTANSSTNATTPAINAFTVFGPRGGLSDANLLANGGVNNSTGVFSVLTFSDGGANDKVAYFQSIIPEGSIWSSLNLILKFGVEIGSGNVEWAVSMQKPTGPTDITFTTESLRAGSVNSTSWSTLAIPINVPTGLTEGDFYRIKLRRSITTNDTSTQSVNLLSAELRAV